MAVRSALNIDLYPKRIRNMKRLQGFLDKVLAALFVTRYTDKKSILFLRNTLHDTATSNDLLLWYTFHRRSKSHCLR
ncbi:hypothetical protein ACE8FZ_09795 [Peribacillus frigoritolerans]|uniref:hypothetical protein n=1 Tax=Peribacillus frigoritolerans TaxID=450367 RepID=UPI0035D00D66|nr:hypothetical protein [Bacillaceae bacterium OS4b]